MKKLIIAIILLAGSFVSCEDNADLIGTWVCETVAWGNEKATTITLKFYPTGENEGKFHSTVTNDHPYIIFSDDVWLYYKIEGDMMRISSIGEFPPEIDRQSGWIIRRHIDGVLLELGYAGFGPAIPITNRYLFLKQ